jgi:hypothetical protein
LPLTKQLIPISFFSGIDNKSDAKQAVPGSLLILENGVFKNPGKISKRNGFDALTRSSTDGNISQGKALTGLNNELLAFTGSDVLGFSESENLWINRGKDYVLDDQTSSVFSNNSGQTSPECKVLNDIECYVWEDFETNSVRYSLIDHLNGSIILSNQVVELNSSTPKVIVFNSQFVIIYLNSNQLFIRTIDPNNYSAISENQLLVNDLDLTNPNFDVLSPLVSDGYFYLTHCKTTDGYTSLTYFSSPSISNGTEFTYPFLSTSCINLWDDDLGNVWVSGGGYDVVSNKNILSVACVMEKGPTKTVISSGFQVITLNYYQNINKISGFKNTLSGENTIYYELTNLNPNTYDTTEDLFGANIVKAIVLIDGTLIHNTVFKRRISLYSKPFFYNNEYFSLFTTQSSFQSTYYLINNSGQIISRSNVNQGGGSTNKPYCTDCVVIDPISGEFIIPLNIQTTFLSNDNQIYRPLSVNVVRYNFTTDNGLISNVLGNSLNISGSVFKTYDGINLTENNFFQYPENTFVDGETLVFGITQPGTPTQPQITEFDFINAYKIGNGSYFTIGTLDTNWFIYFRKDGIFISAPPGDTIIVDITSQDTYQVVAGKVAKALPSSVFTSTNNGSGHLTITNVLIGSGTIPPPTTGTVNSGNISAGTYLYKAIYEWTDNLGQIQRSGTSVAVSATTNSDNGNIAIVVPCLTLTEKTNVTVAIFRTESLGSTIYYRITSPLDPIVISDFYNYVSYIDNTNDTDILANELLYTTGGVLDNSAPPSSSMSALYKNRIFIGGLEDGNLLWYSKTNTNTAPPEFSEFLTLKVNPKFGFITALGVMDDKLIIFKEDGISMLVGNGPTSTGDSDDFENGFQEVATDIGCIEPKSVVLFPGGLMFKSRKGIYVLNRSLQTQYIGSNVESFNQYNITSAVLNPLNNQVRFTTNSSNILVYDYYVNQWAVFTNLPANDSCYIGENYYLIKADGTVYKENVDSFNDNGQAISLKIQTNWLCSAALGTTSASFSKIAGFQRLWRMLITGSYYGPHILNVQFSYDFNNFPSQFTEIDAATLIGQNSLWGSDLVWGEDGTVWGGDNVQYSWRTHLTQQKCTAIMITIFDSQTSNYNEGYDLSALTFEVGSKVGGNKLPVNSSFGNST